MVRIVLRTLVVLVAIGIVCGGICWLSQSDAGRFWVTGNMGRDMRGMERGFDSNNQNANGVQPARKERGALRNPGSMGTSTNPTGQTQSPFPPQEMRGREGGGSPMGWFGVARNAGIIALVTLSVALVQQILSWVSRKRRPKSVQTTT